MKAADTPKKRRGRPAKAKVEVKKTEPKAKVEVKTEPKAKVEVKTEPKAKVEPKAAPVEERVSTLGPWVARMERDLLAAYGGDKALLSDNVLKLLFTQFHARWGLNGIISQLRKASKYKR